MSKTFKQWLVFLLAIIILVAAFLLNAAKLGAPPGPPPKKVDATEIPVNGDESKPAKKIRDVSTISVISDSYRSQIKAFGTVRPQYQLTLKSQVSGSLLDLNPEFEEGLKLKKNTQLVRIDDTDYQVTLASAQADLSAARLSYLETEREAIQAKSDWALSQSKSQPNSPLALYEPQLEAAKKTIELAKKSLLKAQKDLRNTRIKTPFESLVIERFVAPGSYIQQGDDIATLYSIEKFLVELPLPSSDWKKLSLEPLNNQVTLSSTDNNGQWHGTILRLQDYLNDSTRQRNLIIKVKAPLSQFPPLIPGAFVSVDVEGQEVADLWKLPSSALSQQGKIWYLSKQNTLDNFITNIQFSDSDFIYIKVPKALLSKPYQVLTQPLNSYLKGLKVNPVDVNLTLKLADK